MVMSEFDQIVAQIESGSTDIASCLSSRPELSRDDQLQLALADQKYRVQRGEACGVEHYAQFLSWLAYDPAAQQQLIVSEFTLRLGKDSAETLLTRFESLYADQGEALAGALREKLQHWNDQRLDPDRFDQMCDNFEDAIGTGAPPSIESYLRRVPIASYSELLRELLLIETYHLARGGKSFKWEEYHRRFPSEAELIGLVEKQHHKQIPPHWHRSSDEPHSTQSKNSTDLSGSHISKHTVGDLRNGRYRFARKLGQGTYGAVYLAQDMDLKRRVAVKIPSREALEKLVDVDSYLVEAQNVAALDHPHIVTVYDLGRTLDGSIYVVSKFIDGCSLAEWIQKKPVEHKAIAKLLEQIADALHHAHQRRMIHRDIKPANILIEEATGVPYVADFGLAIREEDYLQDGRVAGTPSYMSPEQVRGEGHRLDGRSDLYSLGVVMYQMLTGRLPFPSQTHEEIAHEITTLEPPAPRSLRTDIPAELERICLKLLRKRASERYGNGKELAEDLHAWLTPCAIQLAKTATQKITPRGLRSFTADDSGFFFDLLPGPRDRDGLPESIAFWKERIEQRDPDQTFTVGLLYGPSGCGKTSLVKAGLIPHLSPEVIAIHVEATPEATEQRMLGGLRKAIPELPEDLGLVDTLKQLRRGQFNKVVLIVDQFEQWLYANSDYADVELTNALRQCDGGHVQSIVMIRDDFAMAAARFMAALDVPIVQGVNFATVDMFDSNHARKVLIEFGQAFEKISTHTQEHSVEQNRFFDQVVSGLAKNGKIVSVQIALFAEMVKDKPWVISTLEDVGGTEGIGVSFLEETFIARSANPKYKLHEQAARELLAALLPEVGSDIKGHMRSHEALLQESIYKDRPREFEELLRILDGQLRLITPTDPEGSLKGELRSEKMACRSNISNFTGPTSHFQLTHDYLVPSLREWLTRGQGETKKGRAELKLAERAATWSAKPENKQLPTLWEWLTIKRLTEKRKWKPSERAVMERANRYHLARSGLVSALCVMLMLGGVALKRWNDARQLNRDATNLVASLQTTDFAKIPEKIERLDEMREVVVPKLREALEEHDPQSDERLKLSLGLLACDSAPVDYLVQRLLTAPANQVPLLIDQLAPYSQTILSQLWAAAQQHDPNTLLQSASALAQYDPDSEQWQTIARQVSGQVVRENPLRIAVWMDALRPAAKSLNPELKHIYSSPAESRSQTEIDLATEILDSYAVEDFQLLHELILVGQPKQFSKLFDKYARFKQQAIDELRAELARPFNLEESNVGENATGDVAEARRLATIQRQANAAVALVQLEDPTPVYQFLTVDRDPEALSQFIYRIRGREVSPSLLIKSFQELQAKAVPDDAIARQQHYYRLYGFVLGLGEYSFVQLPAQLRDAIAKELAELYGTHPSRAVHSALGWLLRRWGKGAAVRRVDETHLDYDESGVREWYVLKIIPPATDYQKNLAAVMRPKIQAFAKANKLRNLERLTGSTPQKSARFNKPPTSSVIEFSAPIYFKMIVFPGGKVTVGDSGQSRRVQIAGPIAVSDREVTWRQFSPIDGDTRRQNWNRQRPLYQQIDDPELGRPDEAAHGINWFEAVNYCRWLTSAVGLDEQYQSYEKLEIPESAVTRSGRVELPVDTEWPKRRNQPGFRLPTEAEWEYVARAGTETQYSFGTSDSLLAEYCWYLSNSEQWSHPAGQLRPSLGGLFDIHGNLWEWVDDWYQKGSSRVNRGGGWGVISEGCRSAVRDRYPPVNQCDSLGFRLLRSFDKSALPKTRD